MLCRKPLSCRPYMQTFGLRSTVAWVLVHLAQINKNQVVLDPMCGTAAVLMEAVHCHKVNITNTNIGPT